jgi:hypothetical protein
MTKSVMAKLPRLLGSLLSLIMLCCLVACGNDDSNILNFPQITSFSASPTELAAGQASILTVTVADSAGKAVSGATVNFSFTTNNSGATLVTSHGITDTGGKTIAVYSAGNNNPYVSLDDTIEAKATKSGYTSTSAVVITRTAATAGTTGGSKITVDATPTSLVAGEMSVIIAKVTDTNGSPVSGQLVTFSLPVNNSGASLTNPTSITDTAGVALTVYTAGYLSSAVSTQDAVMATLNGGQSTAAVIITLLPSAGTGYRIVEFTEDPDTNSGNPLRPSNSYVTMTVKVTTDDGATPAGGVGVSFSILAGGGTIFDAASNTAELGDSPLTVSTDNSGKAYVIFTRPSTGSGDTVIRAQISGTTYGGDTARIVYWTDTTTTP